MRVRRVRRGWLSAPASTGRDVTCAFNPCSVPNFCGDGRTCKMDDKCMHHCECDAGSSHDQCVDISTKSTTPPTIKCTFDPCSSAAFSCSGKRKCELGEFCIPQCVCTDDSDHVTCKRDDSLLSTPTSPSDGQCKTCVHGDCVYDTCKCHDGWKGDTCNTSACTKLCNEGFDCHMLPTSVQICIYNHSKHATSTTSGNVHGDQTQDSCHPSYVSWPSDARTCKSGLVCQFGKCSSMNGMDTCECDKGALGDMCQLTCCLDCGANMTCTRDSGDLIERCDCLAEYTGDNCTEPISSFSSCKCHCFISTSKPCYKSFKITHFLLYVTCSLQKNVQEKRLQHISILI